ncbi:hypothetical protein [Sinorhizobium saheli]|uniref:hypothetical protein n=1 Tax=Sinorhizobium saheli TaxID=36856 RepID=UPI0014288D85|nr:hypothetical protein [Sinorhizobium saheli]
MEQETARSRRNIAALQQSVTASPSRQPTVIRRISPKGVALMHSGRLLDAATFQGQALQLKKEATGAL